MYLWMYVVGVFETARRFGGNGEDEYTSHTPLGEEATAAALTQQLMGDEAGGGRNCEEHLHAVTHHEQSHRQGE
jgi:hypothetical protein